MDESEGPEGRASAPFTDRGAPALVAIVTALDRVSSGVLHAALADGQPRNASEGVRSAQHSIPLGFEHARAVLPERVEAILASPDDMIEDSDPK